MTSPNAIMPSGSNRTRIPINAIAVGMSIRVSRIAHHRAPILRLLHTHHLHIRILLGTPRRGQQVDKKGKSVECEHERDDPLKYTSHVLLLVNGRGSKDNGEADVDNNESQFGPEADTEDAVLAEMDAEALVLDTYEYGADDVAGDKEEEEAVMKAGVV